MQALRERLAVKLEDLRRRLDPATLPFQTTATQEQVDEAVAIYQEARLKGAQGLVPDPGWHCIAGDLPRYPVAEVDQRYVSDGRDRGDARRGSED